MHYTIRALQVRGNCLWFWSLQGKVKEKNFAKCLSHFCYQWGSRRHEWLINYCLLSIQMASESPLVLSVFLSVHQYPPLRHAISISCRHKGKTGSPNVKRFKTVGPKRKTTPTHVLYYKRRPRRSFTRSHFVPRWKHVSCRDQPGHLRDLWLNEPTIFTLCRYIVCRGIREQYKLPFTTHPQMPPNSMILHNKGLGGFRL